VQWATLSEINNFGFYIERSTNGQDWVSVGFVAGAGTSNASIVYRWTDENLAASNVNVFYYRLRQADLDGSEHLTSSVVLSKATHNEANNDPLVIINISPNPVGADQLLTLLINVTLDDTYVIRCHDHLGKLVYEKSVAFDEGLHLVEIPVNRMADGVYLLTVNKNNWSAKVKFVKVN
jgi:hypothetical protein